MAKTANSLEEPSRLPTCSSTSRRRQSVSLPVVTNHVLEDDVLCAVTGEDIPPTLRQHIEREDAEELCKMKERREAHLYAEIAVKVFCDRN